MSVRGWAGRVALALCLLGGLLGCVNVPTGGRVTSGRPAERAGPVDDPYVRLIPVPPGKDWLPAEIVQGFLTASAAFDDAHAVAKMYLAPTVDWEPDPRPSVTIYEGSLKIAPPAASGPGDGGTRIQVTGRQLGTIGQDGQYQAITGRVDQSFQLGKDANGQWRITALPDALRTGMLLGQRDVDRAFRTLNLYFFVPDGTVLVPNPIFLPLINRREMPSQLVRAVLSGPTSWLGRAVRTEFPPGTELLGDRVDVTEGVATVNLSRQAARGSLSGMSAQLMWTLRQLPEVTRMRLEIDGEPVSPPGVGTTQQPHDWRNNDADVTPQRSHPVYLRADDGQLQELNGDHPEAVGRPGAVRLYHPAASIDERFVAGLNESRTAVLTSDVGGGTPRRVLDAPDPDGRFITPSWDRLGALWMVENHRGGSRLWVKEQGRTPIPIRLWDLRGQRLKALRVARDGVRVAVIVEMNGNEQIQMGRIVREPAGVTSVSNFLPVSSEIVDAADLAWHNANELAVLGSTQRQPLMVPYQVPVSGGQIRAVGTGGGDMISITALPHSPLLIGMRVKEKGRTVAKICRQRDESDPISEWKCFAGGHDPGYPG
ncbi:MAG TPA: LpqB family beta-propeller domain-containing protein [Streptosporangiaceae bacterium]|nr:LpqB family beta-propeller domain-containing protein [Streptosporangiaceae bacterium]